jgi:hypothetical protein
VPSGYEAGLAEINKSECKLLRACLSANEDPKTSLNLKEKETSGDESQNQDRKL